MSQVGSEVPLTIEEEVIRDHNEMREFYTKYKTTGDVAWYNQYLWEMSRHAIAEELVWYPELEKLAKDSTKIDRQQHQQSKEAAVALEKMKKPSAEFDAAFSKLAADLDEHMQREEREDIPMWQKNVSLDERRRLGKTFQFRKKIVPTRPHVAPPDDGSILEDAMGLMMAPVDKFRDLFRTFPKEAD